MPGMKALGELLGESPGIRAVRERVARLLERPAESRRLPPILIQGETGTGKGLLARMIHRAGPRPDGPFVDVNCAAIPDTLLEAEMFGFERGAFTDARRSKPGLFQAAHRGTIFLDEVGLLPEALQAKLLKVLEERSVRRLGATRDEPIDVWIVTATNEDLRLAIRARRFREDLYHRLAVLTVALPPLRERGEDIVALAEHFLARVCADYGVAPKTFAENARAALRTYTWPGNVRELSNVVERAVLQSTSDAISADHLGLETVVAEAARPEAVSLDAAMREHLVEVLTQTGWNISRTAGLLGISRNTLRARMDKYGLREREGAPKPAARPRPGNAAVPAAPAPAVRPTSPPGAPVSARRWERRRLAFLRAALVPATGPEASLATGRILEAVVDKVTTFGGVLEGLGPIGLVAVFGLDAAGDVGDRAGYAAMAILKAMERSQREEGADVGVRLGVHVATALISVGGGGITLDMDERHDLRPLLDELVERTPLNTILVTESSAPFLRRRFELAAGPGPMAHGMSTRVLIGRERTGLGLGGRLAEFVGRRAELDLLRARFDTVRRGQGHVVGLVGEAGIGKSRLVHEFRQGLVAAGVDCLEAHCFAHVSGVPYLPLLDLVRSLCGLLEFDTPEAIDDKVRRALGDLGLDGQELSPYLLHLLGMKEGADRVGPETEAAIHARIFEILRQVLRRRSQRAPLVVLADDLHWIDQTSAEFFDTLVDGLPASAILLVVTARPGYRPPWFDKSYATHVMLQPLDTDEARRVVSAVLGGRTVADSVVDAILARAEGNAFFLEELVRAVREQQAPAATVVVPETVQDVLQTRIERLSPEDRRLLTAAAVVGKDFARSRLEAAVDAPAGALRDALARLQAAEFLYETAAGPDPVYTFRHTLTHEVAYGHLPIAERRALHARMAEALAAQTGERSGEDVARIAHHALQAERWELALAFLREAGARAFSGGAHREAAACFEQALGVLARLPATLERRREAVDLRIELRTALLPLGEHERIFTHLGEAEALATSLGEPPRLGRVCTYLTNYFFITGDADRALDYGRRALALAEGLGDFPLWAEAKLRLGQVHHALGDYREAAEMLAGPLASLPAEMRFERFGLPLVFAVGCRSWLIRCLAELGRFDEGFGHGEEAVRIAEAVAQPFSRVVAYWSAGLLCLRKGELERAVDVLERGLGVARQWAIQVWTPRLAALLGSALTLTGKTDTALPMLAEAVEDNARMRATRDHAWAVLALGDAQLLAGRVAEAMAAAEQVLEQARRLRDRGMEAWALRLRGESLVHEDAPAAAGAFAASLEIADARGMQPLAAHCRLGLGRSDIGAGRRADGVRRMEEARAAYAALDMRLWVVRASAELARLG